MPDPRINDFSGGETDRFRDGPPNSCEVAKNLYVNTQRRLETRPGYNGVSSGRGNVKPWGSQAIDMLWHHFTNYDSDERIFITFAMSNGAVKYNANDSNDWFDVQAAGSAVGDFQFMTTNQNQKDGWKYVRLGDNEFVVIQPGLYPIKFYRESISTSWTAVVLGLPEYNTALFGNNLVNPSFVVGGNNYSWAICLKHEYELFDRGTGSITKIVRGAPAFSRSYPNVEDPSIASADVVLPPITSGQLSDNELGGLKPASELFSPDVVWEIYRTLANGTVYYKVGEIAADGTDFVDDQSDDDIRGNEVLYTTGNVVGNQLTNTRPFTGTIANSCLWLASESRIWQSKVGIPDAFPGSFVFQVRESERIEAIETIDIYPIVFTNLGVYRIEGIVDDLGNGTHRVRTVSGAETKGAYSQKTTVKADNSIFYWSIDGIYETNGYTARKVSDHYNDRYRDITEALAQTETGGNIPAHQHAESCWDRENLRVHWIYPMPGDVRATQTLTMDTKYKNPDGGYCLTSGDVPYEVSATSAADRNIYIGTASGQLVRQEYGRTFDLSPSDNTNGELGGPSILWDYKTCSMSMGSDLIRKWFSRILFNFTNRGPLTLGVQSDTDEDGDWRDHNPVIRRRSTSGFHWFKRYFPKGRLRGSYKRIRMTNSEPKLIYKSDDLGTATVSGDTLTLDSGNWPLDIHRGDYYFLFSPSSTKYFVRSIGSDSFPFTAVNNLRLLDVPTPGQKDRWELYASPNDESIEINSYTIVFGVAGEGHAQSSVQGVGNE